MPESKTVMNSIVIPEAYFLDIETVASFEKINDAPDMMQRLFQKRFKKDIMDSGSVQDVWEKNAPMYAEFGKIVSIAIGKIIYTKEQTVQLRIKTICGRDEKAILEEFLTKITQATKICAHNGLEFDFAFIFRRLLINGIHAPYLFIPYGRKTWDKDYPFEDTKEMWSGSAWRHMVSLDLMAFCLGIESPKTEMSGSDVGRYYYSTKDENGDDLLPFDIEDNLKKIGKYNAGDVVVLAKIYLKLKQNPLVITQDQIVFT